jgi:hypothetical protein
MDYSDKWLGLAGGGGGFSVIGGVGVYQIDLYKMDGSPVPMRVLSVGKRLGITAQAEFAHAVCLLTGVRSANGFTSVKSNGLDWALSFGVKADSLLKTGGKAAKAIMDIAVEGGGWAGHEVAKKAVQGLMGDFSLSPKEPSFVLLPTPAAFAVGAGIYYEWQELTKVGGDLGWKYAPPTWKFENRGGNLFLRMSRIPAQDGDQINFQIRIDGWGIDDTIMFAPPGQTKGKYYLSGRVYGGKLYELGSTGKGKAGVNLTVCQPTGLSTSGFFGVDVDKNIPKSQFIELGVSVCKGVNNIYHWSSERYLKVHVDDFGRLDACVFSTWGN